MKILKKVKTGIKNWWITFRMTPEEVYLNNATDIVDLEHRLRMLATKPFEQFNSTTNYR